MGASSSKDLVPGPSSRLRVGVVPSLRKRLRRFCRRAIFHPPGPGLDGCRATPEAGSSDSRPRGPLPLSAPSTWLEQATPSRADKGGKCILYTPERTQWMNKPRRPRFITVYLCTYDQLRCTCFGINMRKREFYAFSWMSSKTFDRRESFIRKVERRIGVSFSIRTYIFK